MRLGFQFLSLALVCWTAAARAQVAAGDGGVASDTASPAPADAGQQPGAAEAGQAPATPPSPGEGDSIAVGPTPLAPITPAYPAEAVRERVSGDVLLMLTIDASGAVTNVEVEQGLPSGLTESAVAAARAARFRPAADAQGKPVAVRIKWRMTFTLPEVREPLAPPAAPAGAAPPGGAPPKPGLPPGVETFATGPNGMLKVAVRQKGTGKRLATASVFIEDRGEVLRVDNNGRAERELAPGAYVVIVRAPDHAQEEHIERIQPGQRLEKTYFIERERLNPYQTIVRAPPPRAQTGVVTLEAEEIHKIPGTFGDPFRAVMLLPGVSSPISGLGYPAVRGESPGSTGAFIDGIRVPYLYHLFVGPAVVHPMYLESLDFHAGGFPAEFGRFTAGLINARTKGIPEERQSMAEVDLFKFSGFHTQPFDWAGHKSDVTASARYGTLTFLARALDPTAVFEYWDYQLRNDVRVGPGTARLLVFGAQDTVGTKQIRDENGDIQGRDELTRLGFHRADLRYRAARRNLAAEAGVEVGLDYTTVDARMGDGPGGGPDGPGTRPPPGGGGGTGDSGGGGGMARMLLSLQEPVEPAIKLREYVVRPRLTVDGRPRRDLRLRTGGDLLFQNWRNVFGGAEIGDQDVAELFFPPRAATFGAFLQGEWTPNKDWLVAVGVRTDHYRYHYAAEDVIRTTVDPRLAARYKVEPGIYLKGTLGLYHGPPRFLAPWPGFEGFDLQKGMNESYQLSLGSEWELPWDATLDAQVYLNWLTSVVETTLSEFPFAPRRCHGSDDPACLSYGLELIARRRLGQRLFGWVTYSLSRSERVFADAGVRPSDYDQTHVVNTVVSYALGRSWTVSATFHFNTGRPVTPAVQRNDPTPDRGGWVSIEDCFQGAGEQQPPECDEVRAGRNSDRLPPFWRIDARIEKREAFDTWFLDFYVDWLNISFQREVTGYSYGYGAANQPRRYRESTLLTIPTLGLRAVF